MQMPTLLTNTSATFADLAAWRRIWQQRHPHEIVRLIGSREWIAQQQRIALQQHRRFVPIKSLKRAYTDLSLAAIHQINARSDTLYGKELDPNLINHLELILSLRLLPTMERDCWIFATWDQMTYAEVAAARATTVESVKTMVSAAGKRLIERIFEPLMVEIHL